MQERTLPKLLVSREEAFQQIRGQIEKGEKLRDQSINSESQLDEVGAESNNWSRYNTDLLIKLFDSSALTDEDEYIDFNYHPLDIDEMDFLNSEYNVTDYLGYKTNEYRTDMADSIKCLEGILDRLDLFDELSDTASHSVSNSGTHVFIGHGRSQDWRELKDFVDDRLGLPYDEFNRVPIAGVTNIARLAEMLDQACMAFLVMTAEDEQADGTLHARENVIHEAGLFQGRLGFERAIILLEEDCQEFSNIHGLGQIRFPKGNIKAVFEEIREVLEREGIIA